MAPRRVMAQSVSVATFCSAALQGRGRCLQRAGACRGSLQVVVELNLAARPGGFGAAERELPAVEGEPPRFEGAIAS